MHAYLLIGQGLRVKGQSEKLAQKLNAKILEFPLAKIADTRSLGQITKLAFNAPTAILINSIDLATEEALNAFLKNLEEPQKNIYYILTANSLATVLPTIVSRCEVIKVQSTEYTVHSTETEKFLELTTGEKLAVIDKIKDRGEAKIFVKNLIEVAHFNLLNSTKTRLKKAMDLETLIKTLNNLKSNGNVQLQLTNMVINSDQIGVNLD